MLRQMRVMAALSSPAESIWMLNILAAPIAEQWDGLAATPVGSLPATLVKLMSPAVGVICLANVAQLRAST